MLLDNSSGTDVIPSLRLVIDDIFADVSAYPAQADAGATAASDVSLEVHAALSGSYFNSSLDIEELLLAVRLRARCCIIPDLHVRVPGPSRGVINVHNNAHLHCDSGCGLRREGVVLLARVPFVHGENTKSLLCRGGKHARARGGTLRMPWTRWSCLASTR